MDVFGEHIGADVQFGVGKIPDAAHAEPDELLGHVLRNGLWHGQHRHIRMAGGEVVLHLVERADEDVVDARADQRGRDIKGRVEQETGLRKVEVAQQRMTQMARADHNEPVPLVHTEDVADLRAQLEDVVAVALLAEFTKAA